MGEEAEGREKRKGEAGGRRRKDEDLRFEISNLSFWISELRSRISDLKFQISDFRFRI
jgi:hypothetical protein